MVNKDQLGSLSFLLLFPTNVPYTMSANEPLGSLQSSVLRPRTEGPEDGLFILKNLLQLNRKLAKIYEGTDPMESKNITGLVIVLIGGLFLFKNLGILPKMTFGLAWPLLLIGLGIAALYATANQQDKSDSKIRVRIGDKEINNPIIVKLIAMGVSVFVIVIVGFVLVGVLAPVFLFLLLLVPFILLIVLGATLLPVLIPIAIFVAPILLIVWLLSLIF